MSFRFGISLFCLLLSASLAASARPRPRYAVPGAEKPVALLSAGRATYLVTEHSVFQFDGQHFVRRQQISQRVQCAAVADTVLWLGTRTGLFGVSTRTGRRHPLLLPSTEAAPSITALFQDAEGNLWVGANGAGVFRWSHGVFVPELNTPAINGGVATADSSVWIATSIGLSRKQSGSWTRYNEEGVANHEIPDNVVEKLLPDNAGNLWVLMSDAICVFEGSQRAAAEAELPTVKFIGRPGNEVSGVAAVPHVGRLFATTQGLLLLPNGPTTLLTGPAPATDKIEPRRLLVPLPPLPGAGNPVLLAVDKRQRLWLADPNGVSVLSPKQFYRFVQSSRAAAGASAKR